mmetsp:Transcript_6833/g.17144  ORF Transcript_6833/g.17144 Transcript_6833/m.17144 type:complete len:98 (+) Transcript_6833:171-464(+)
MHKLGLEVDAACYSFSLMMGWDCLQEIPTKRRSETIDKYLSDKFESNRTSVRTVRVQPNELQTRSEGLIVVARIARLDSTQLVSFRCVSKMVLTRLV